MDHLSIPNQYSARFYLEEKGGKPTDFLYRQDIERVLLEHAYVARTIASTQNAQYSVLY